MAALKLPLSGDVSQFIAPWSWFVRQAGQLGFINVNIGSTPAPQIEERVLEEVGSYGRQLGRLADALEVLVGALDRNSLSREQQAAISAFEAQLAEVRAVKASETKRAEPSLIEPVARFKAPPEPRTDGAMSS